MNSCIVMKQITPTWESSIQKSFLMLAWKLNELVHYYLIFSTSEIRFWFIHLKLLKVNGKDIAQIPYNFFWLPKNHSQYWPDDKTKQTLFKWRSNLLKVPENLKGKNKFSVISDKWLSLTLSWNIYICVQARA